MSIKKPRKLITILGTYFVVLSLFLCAILLYWTYSAAAKVVNDELEKSFEQRYRIAEEVFEREAERIENAIHEVQLNSRLLSDFASLNHDEARGRFQKYEDVSALHKLDVLFISTSDSPVWLDASSPVPDVRPVLNKIAASKRLFLTEPRIVDFENEGLKYSGIFKSQKLIMDNGSVLGIIVGGTIINDNIQLLRKIEEKSKTPIVFITDRKSIVSTTFSDNVMMLEDILSSIAKAGWRSKDNMLRMRKYNSISGFYRLNLLGAGSNLDIVFTLDNVVLRKLQRSYINTLYIIPAIFIIFLLFTFLIIRRFISPSIKSVLDYTEKVSRAEKNISFKGGSIMELNAIGLALEKMVASIHSAQRKLQESEDRFRAAFNSARDCVWIWDREYTYLYANQAAIDHIGTDSERVVGNDIQSVPGHIFDIRNLWIERVDQVFKTKQSLRVQDKQKFSDRVYFSDSILTPIKDIEGNVNSVCVVYRDVSELKQKEEELRKARNYISNIIDSMPSILVGVDPDCKITQWNKTAEQSTGLSVEDAFGQSLSSVLPRISGEIEKITDSIKNREIKYEKKRPRKQKDEIFFEDVTIYPLIANGVIGAVIRIDDVTEKVHMEEMMIQSEKMLSVGGLAAGMAHEINNPLAGMMHNAQNLSNRLKNLNLPGNIKAAEEAGISMEDLRAYMEKRHIFRMLDVIRDSGKRVANIVNNMLSFARKGDTQVSTHNIPKLMDKTLELAATDYDLKKQYDFKTIEIIREYDEFLPPVICKSQKIQQVLLNILRNGAEAMTEYFGEQKSRGIDRVKPHFILRIFREDESNMLRIEIEDNGPGIDDKVRKRIFDPFFTTKPVGEGTGLGLSVSYFIITNDHNGEIAVESEPGKGTKFIIKLPLDDTV